MRYGAAMQHEADELLTVKQAAERLQVHPESIRRWLRAGLLAGQRIGAGGTGASYRIWASELERFIQTDRAPPA